MNVKYTSVIVLISLNKGTSNIFERDVILPVFDIISLTFDNFSLTLELATKFFLKHVKAQTIFERLTSSLPESKIKI